MHRNALGGASCSVNSCCIVVLYYNKGGGHYRKRTECKLCEDNGVFEISTPSMYKNSLFYTLQPKHQ